MIAVGESSSYAEQKSLKELKEKSILNNQREASRIEIDISEEVGQDNSSKYDKEVNILSTYTTETDIEEGCLAEERE